MEDMHRETTPNDTRVWLITGCSKGLGRALAVHALERGDRVAVTARDRSAVTDLAAKYGDSALALRLDVTDPASVTAAVQECERVFGRVDVLVNNAGYGYLAAVEEGEDTEVRALFDTNVHGAVTVLKAVLPGMRARRCGHVVNVSSFGGLAAFPATGYYHATKFALEGLSESLAGELAPLGIRVTIVEPGGMRTEWAGSPCAGPRCAWRTTSRPPEPAAPPRSPYPAASPATRTARPRPSPRPSTPSRHRCGCCSAPTRWPASAPASTGCGTRSRPMRR